MVASTNRSMSQQFWGLEQAKDASAAQKDNAVVQGMVDRLEDENTGLKDDNARWDILNSTIMTVSFVGTLTKTSQEPSPNILALLLSPPPRRRLQTSRSGRQYAAADWRSWSDGRTVNGREICGGDGLPEKQDELTKQRHPGNAGYFRGRGRRNRRWRSRITPRVRP